MLTEDAPLSWDAFSRFATTLTALRGADLLQMKGLLNIAGCRGPVAVQFMGHLAHGRSSFRLGRMMTAQAAWNS